MRASFVLPPFEFFAPSRPTTTLSAPSALCVGAPPRVLPIYWISLLPPFLPPSPQLSENFFYDNIKLALMVIACVFALIAQFYPMPFPESRPLLGVCCLAYFLASTIIQLIVSYVEQDTILTTQPLRSGGKGGEALKVRTQFPRFQDEYTVFVEEAGMQDPPTVSSE